MQKMEEPAYFFVAHVLVRYNAGKTQLDNFKKMVPTASSVKMIKSDTSLYLTLVATFTEPIDFGALKDRLSFYYGGKSKIIKIHHSTKAIPTYFYSVCLVQNFTTPQKHNGLPAQKHALVNAVLALVTPEPVVDLNVYDSSILVEFTDHDVRPEDIASIKTSLLEIPKIAFLSSR